MKKAAPKSGRTKKAPQPKSTAKSTSKSPSPSTSKVKASAKAKQKPTKSAPKHSTKAIPPEPPVAKGTLVLPGHEALAPLNTAEQKLFAEALRRGESAREEMEDLLKDYGTWLFVNVFDNNSTKVIEQRKESRVWQHLVARAGGSTLRLNEQMLNVCVLAAAYDKRLNDDHWRALDLGRKQLLLRLGEDSMLRKGAQHVLGSKLSWRATREYVVKSLEKSGNPVDVRVSVPRVQKWLQGFHNRLTTTGFQRRLEIAAGELDRAERKKLARQIDELQRDLRDLSDRLTK